MWFKPSFTTQVVVTISFCFIAGTSPAVADILHLPDDFSTVKQGIDAVVSGHDMVIANGEYKGDGNRDLDYNGKLIAIRSENGLEKCIIECETKGGRVRENKTQ